MLLRNYLLLNCLPLCLVYACITLLLAFFQQEYSVIPQLTQTLADCSPEVSAVIEFFLKIRGLLIIVPAISIIIRMAVISLCLYIGSFFFFTGDESNTYYRWWNISVKSQVVMVIYGTIVSLLNIFVSSDMAINFPKVTSLCVFWGDQILEQWMQIPLLAVNLFEVILFVLMSILVSKEIQISYGQAFKFVFSAYVIPYAIYLCFLMFVTIYVS